MTRLRCTLGKGYWMWRAGATRTPSSPLFLFLSCLLSNGTCVVCRPTERSSVYCYLTMTPQPSAASEMTYIVSGGALNSIHSLTHAYKKLSSIVTKLLLSKIIHTMVYLPWKIMVLFMVVWVYSSKTQPLTNSCTSILADQHMLLHLYRSLVCSKLNYGRVVYGSARESYLRILDPIQNLSTAALRPCLQNFTCLKYVCISSTK